MSTPIEGPALVLDWGIGGLSVYRELKRLRPQSSVVYVSDSGFTPYGKVPAPDLGERVTEVIQRARREHGVASATIACNAASTVLEAVRAACPELPVHGVIAAGIKLVRDSGCRRVGVIGGVRTIESRIFSSALPGIEVHERVAQPLSALIEAGVLEGPVLERELEMILEPLDNVEALLLACTHYPAIAAPIQRRLPKALLLDPAARAAAEVPVSLATSGDVFFTSGSREASQASALAAFGVRAEFGAWDG